MCISCYSCGRNVSLLILATILMPISLLYVKINGTRDANDINLSTALN